MGLHVGIDFGTTNSALAWSTGGAPTVAAVRAPAAAADRLAHTFRSILFFEADGERERGRPIAAVGPDAIDSYLASGGDGRLMQSMKSFLASRHVRSTNVFGFDYALEQLVARVIEGLWAAAAPALGPTLSGARPARIVAGRPVRFAHADDAGDDAWASQRLRVAFAAAGFPDVELVPEPVAAALHYEAELDHDELVLVADFGGGTSDFCLLQVGPRFRAAQAGAERVLGTRGVGVAGDSLDARIIQRLVAPALGAGSRYRTMTRETLEIPRSVFDKLRRWNELSFMKTPRNMEMLLGYARSAVEPGKLAALVHLVEHDLGYRLYRAVEAVKVALSRDDASELRFADGPIDLKVPVTRDDFEGWIVPELAALATTVDALLAETGVDARAVDSVFLTGGTAQVPAVRRLFAERFGEDRLHAGSYHTSIASGLALWAAAHGI